MWIPVNVTILFVLPWSVFSRKRLWQTPIGVKHPCYRAAVFYLNLIFFHVYIDFLRFKR